MRGLGRDPSVHRAGLAPAVAFALLVATVGTLYLGIFPGRVLAWAAQSSGILK